MLHILYSRGRLLDKVDWQAAVENISVLTQQPTEKVEAQLLSGRRKRIKSSESRSKLIGLKRKLINHGLDVYIESNNSHL